MDTTIWDNDVDKPWLVNGFRGTWNFSNHNLIPDVFAGFLQRYFGVYRIRRIPLADINRVMNEVWEGPGSLPRVLELEREMAANGKDIKFTTADLAALKAKATDDEEDSIEILLDSPMNSFNDFVEEDEED